MARRSLALCSSFRARGRARVSTLLAALCFGGALCVGSFWFGGGYAHTEARVVTQRFSISSPRAPEGREQAIAIWVPPTSADEKLPIVIAFHGKGEAALGRARGYTAWVERYGLGSAYGALLAPPVTSSAFGGLVRDAELTALNAELKARPFRGLLVVGVYTPDLLGEANRPEVEPYAAWIARELVPEVRRTFPFASSAPGQVGVDGVSLGGMVALEVGLRHPEIFGAVGTMQPAIRGREAELAALADRARRVRPQALRLLSSDADPLLPVTAALSRELRTRRIAHQFTVTPGGHDYAFNRGPGAVELLRFHDRALRPGLR